MTESESQTIISTVTNIKVSGIATMWYWSIVETVEKIYFVHTSTALGLGVGTNVFLMLGSVLGDILGSRKAKRVAGKDLTSILADAVDYFGFSKESARQIQVKKKLLGGGRIGFPNGKEKSWREAGKITLKLSRKKFASFNEMLKRKLA